MQGHEQLTDLYLPGLDRALHFGLLDQRILRMNDDVDLAVGRLLHVRGELQDVPGLIVPLVRACRHVPFVRKRRGTRQQCGCEASGSQDRFQGWLHDAPSLGRSLWTAVAGRQKGIG